MILRLSDFLTQAGRDRVLAEKQEKERLTICAFLRENFAPATALLNDKQLEDVVKLALVHADQRGITNMRDRQRYLIPVMFWGSYFELDPQYRAGLAYTWWFDDQGRRTTSTYMSGVIAEIDRMEAAIARDLADANRVVAVLARLYRDHDGDAITQKLTLETMQKCWPARFALMTDKVRRDYIAAIEPSLQRYELHSVDAISYICLAMHLGFRFVDDPRFPWAAEALVLDGRPLEERRLALGQALMTYWHSLKTTERP